MTDRHGEIIAALEAFDTLTPKMPLARACSLSLPELDALLPAITFEERRLYEDDDGRLGLLGVHERRVFCSDRYS